MSWSYVWAFMATMRSYSGALAVQPSALTRISYHVGRPWMLDGKRFLPDTGTLIRKMPGMSKELARAEPVPLTLASLTAKSLTRVAGRARVTPVLMTRPWAARGAHRAAA